MPHRYPLILVCGATGHGKTEVVNAAVKRLAGRLQIIPTCTSRSPRPGEERTPWYRFASRQAVQEMIDRGQAVNWAEFGGELYVSLRREVDTILTLTCGVQIVVEPSVTIFREARYPVIAVNLIGVNVPSNDRAKSRLAEDAARQGSIKYDEVIYNHFDPNGEPGELFEEAVNELCFIVEDALN